MGVSKIRVVSVSGGFDPLHYGHLHLIKKARHLGNHLMVILKRDDQCVMKKHYVFMPYEERKEILESMRWVDEVVENIDEDLSSCKSLEKYRPNIFARGGDSLGKDELLESEVCKRLGIEIVVGVGGSYKEQSSSQLVRDNLKIFCIYVDGIICSNVDNKYETHIPIQNNIDKVNSLYDRGNKIKLFTARGSSSGIDHRELTERQMKEWGVKYNELIVGKPGADAYLDDRNINIEEFLKL